MIKGGAAEYQYFLLFKHYNSADSLIGDLKFQDSFRK